MGNTETYCTISALPPMKIETCVVTYYVNAF